MLATVDPFHFRERSWKDSELVSKYIKWTDRVFDFSFPVGVFPEMIERVRGTPARLQERASSVDPEMLTKRDGERWSIQENAGHLLDLESLFSQRLDEYLAGAEVLHAADMTNRKTYEAHHNDVAMQTILEHFRDRRQILVSRLEKIEPDVFAKTAHHPRLNVPMRLVDMLYFQSEHDDFHLARISELIRLFQ